MTADDIIDHAIAHTGLYYLLKALVAACGLCLSGCELSRVQAVQATDCGCEITGAGNCCNCKVCQCGCRCVECGNGPSLRQIVREELKRLTPIPSAAQSVVLPVAGGRGADRLVYEPQTGILVRPSSEWVTRRFGSAVVSERVDGGRPIAVHYGIEQVSGDKPRQRQGIHFGMEQESR